PDVRVTPGSSNEHDCNGLFPCPGIDYLNQYGDYEGLVSYGGVSHPIWTDSRRQLEASAGCRTDLAMEEVVSATVHLQDRIRRFRRSHRLKFRTDRERRVMSSL